MVAKPNYKELEQRVQELEHALTECKKDNDAIKNTSELILLFLKNSPIYAFLKEVKTDSSIVLFASENYIDMIGIPSSQMIGKTMGELFPQEFAEKMTHDDIDVVSKGKNLKLDEEFNGKYYLTYKFPIIKGDKKYLAGYTIDITDKKQHEKEKLEAQRIAKEQENYAFVGQIAGGMAHDFNNILSAIMGNTELSLLDCKDDKLKQTLEIIFEQTIRGRNLIKNLMAFAKDQEPKQEYFSINDKIDLVLNLLKKEMQGILLKKEWSPGLPLLLADPGMVEHCFVNLIQNSIHAISQVDNPTIKIRSFFQDEFITVEIEDNGCGIPKEHINQIFDPVFTLKGRRDVRNSYQTGIKGTGYGMANVKRYVDQHNGTITIYSEVGEGTKITIRFPEIKTELSETEKAQIEERCSSFEKFILLIEDELAISNVQYKILTDEPCNHKVDVAASGQVAIDLFDRNQYDFVSLDYMLPGQINGIDVYRHIRKTNKRIPILFISGNLEFLESIKHLRNEDPNIDHVSKPCPNVDYISRINGLLRRVTF